MKKLSKMLALGLAMALTFGMTTFAAESPNPNASQEANAMVESVAGVTTADGEEVTYTALDAEDLTGAISVLYDDEEIVFGLDVKVTGAATIVISNSLIKADADYVVLHEYAEGKWEELDYVVTKDGEMQITSDDWSPVVIVEVVEADDDDDDDEDREAEVAVDGGVVSPKTGEALPVAGVMAVICLAGVAFCTKKVRMN